MKRIAATVVALGMSVFTFGCSEEAQLQDAQNDLREERVETQEEINDAVKDGVVTPSEEQGIREERAEDVEAAGDVVEQAGDVVKEKND